jgi:hypothetical protein
VRLFDLLETSPLDNPAFLKWFAGSKVVDTQGQPLRVYHGTAKEFDGFSGISNGIDGIYFSSAPSIADQYADYDQGEGEGGQVYPTYLSMKNPLVIDYQAYLKKMNDGVFADERDERGEFASEVVNDIVDTAKDFGKDGVILHGIRDGWTDNSELATTFIVFSAKQIKSVFNKGTWNPNTPKLSESVGGPEFQRWFRDSKIVDWSGRPLAVHHGTAIPKTQFRSFRGHDMHGIYFTPNRDAAQDHADMDSEIDGDDPLIISVYLSIQNPLIVSEGIVDDPRVTGKGTVGMMDYQQLTTEMLNLIVADGYDGIVITDGTVEDASEIVAFNSNQVKSVDNRGGWNPDVPHLHESIDVEPDWGVRLGSSFKLWRGESESSGSNGASYGAGLYTTTNRSYAAKYGKVREVPRWEALPDNPLRFRTIQDWELWLQRYDQHHGILGARDRGQKHNDIGDYIRIVFPKADGVQIGSGTDAMFVAWPEVGESTQ